MQHKKNLTKKSFVSVSDYLTCSLYVTIKITIDQIIYYNLFYIINKIKNLTNFKEKAEPFIRGVNI
jgi:hypothetical protein